MSAALAGGMVVADNCGSLSDCFSGNLLPAVLLTGGLLLLLAGSWYLWPAIARLGVSLAMRQALGRGLRSRVGYAAARYLSRFADRTVKYPIGSLQHVFDRHRRHWGFTGNWNKAAGPALQKVLEAHVRDPRTLVRRGYFRNKPATHFYNPFTRRILIRDVNGDLWSGWRLSRSQRRHVFRTGRLS
jgi:Colicin D